MTELSPKVRELTGLNERLEQQISEEVALILEKMLQGIDPTEEEKSILVNPVEAGAIVSIKSHRPVNHRYIKEISRATIGKERKPAKSRRLEPAKIAGKTYLYRLGKVYELNPVGTRSPVKYTENEANASPSAHQNAI